MGSLSRQSYDLPLFRKLLLDVMWELGGQERSIELAPLVTPNLWMLTFLPSLGLYDENNMIYSLECHKWCGLYKLFRVL